MFPYRDDNPTLRTPVITIALIVLNVAAWLVLQGAGTEPALSRSICELGLTPGELLGRVDAGTGLMLTPTAACVVGTEPAWHTLLSSMFMHGGWAHLIGNMWFLWVFGNNVEDVMGRWRFPVFYALCALVAAGAQMLTAPDSIIPMVGASGAIGGVMGAYIVLFPRVRVHLFVFLGFFFTTVAVPAYFMLGYWFVLQLVSGLPALGQATGGVAFWAHVGGFLAGAALVYPFRNRRLVEAHAQATGIGVGPGPQSARRT